MLKHTLLGIASITLLVVALLAMSAVADDAATSDQPEADPFIGWYTKGLLGEAVHITREGDSYRINKTTGKDFVFHMQKQGVLEDEQAVLGTLTLGELNFADAPDNTVIVLKAEFCYEHFLLIKQPVAPEVEEKTPAPESAKQGT